MDEKKETKAKGFFARLIDKLDKKMEEKARQEKCGCKSKESKEDSCCK